jgi:hypothetical protein
VLLVVVLVIAAVTPYEVVAADKFDSTLGAAVQEAFASDSIVVVSLLSLSRWPARDGPA